MYPFKVRLGTFGTRVPDTVLARLVSKWVLALAHTNIAYLTEHPRTPRLYSSGVFYEEEKEDVWMDIPQILKEKKSDCEGLVAWRLPELWREGVRASPNVQVQRPSSEELLFHVRIVKVTKNGLIIEDPSLRLGMET